MKFLAPLHLRDKYFIRIEEEIKRIFFKLLYAPLLQVIGVSEAEVQNSTGALLDAIIKGTIYYEDGQIKGKFNARISREIMELGGVFNATTRSWHIPMELFPVDLKFAQQAAQSKYQYLVDRIKTRLDEMNAGDVDLISRFRTEYEKSITEINHDFIATLPTQKDGAIPRPQSVVDKLIIEAKLTPEMTRIIADAYSDNLEKYVKGWAEKEVLEMRSLIQPKVLAGARSQSLVEMIQTRYGVSNRKAKFLARQETALLMSAFQQSRYRDIGIGKYKWSDSHDKRVRHDHHELNGRIFSWDNPPITNKKTGARNNPGEDYNCRCVAIPVIE